MKETEETKASLAALKPLFIRQQSRAGLTVYSITRRTSRSNMSGWYDFYIIRDGEPRWITSLMCKALGYSFHSEHGMKIGGCGYNRPLHAVMHLSREVFTGSRRRQPVFLGAHKLSPGYVLQHESL